MSSGTFRHPKKINTIWVDFIESFFERIPGPLAHQSNDKEEVLVTRWKYNTKLKRVADGCFRA